MHIVESNIQTIAEHAFSSLSESSALSELDYPSFRDTISALGNNSANLAASESTDQQERISTLIFIAQRLLSELLTALSKSANNQHSTGIDSLLMLMQGNATDNSNPQASASLALDDLMQRGITKTTTTTTHTEEHERSLYCASGMIRTADGQCLDFSLDFKQQRDYETDSVSMSQEQIVLEDPLILNFGGSAAQLSGQRFSFDLNGDGTSEWLDELGASSAYLTIDSNHNGTIDDGAELIGARSGNGFNDLSQWDSDHNGWLDEADAAFNDLRLWQPAATDSGGDSLTTLEDAGIGALYLHATATPFTLKDHENDTLGQVVATSLYVTESGKVGTVEQVDLATSAAA